MAGVASGLTFLFQVHGIGATATDNLIQSLNNSNSRLQIGNSLVQVTAAFIPGPLGIAANGIALSMTGVVVTENKVTTVGDLMGMGGSLAAMIAPIATAAGIPLLTSALTLTAAALAIGGLVYTINNIYEKHKDAISTSLGTTPDPLVKTIRYVDPLILDLDGDGIKITPLASAPPVLFDADNDTVRTNTAWASAQDGIVVWDRNGNGTIDSGLELFGDETILLNGPNAGKKAANGFAALADIDANADGVFNASDARYADLRIWRDLNQDGISQANELKTLSDSGVQSISLTSQKVSASYGDAIMVEDGTFTRSDGSTGQAGSFILAQNNFVRQFVPISVSSAAQALPDIGGSGWVRDFQEAATQTPGLIASLNQATNASSRADYKGAVATLLRDWGNESSYNSASKQAIAAGYGLILSNPKDDQERGWMNVAVKGSHADRDAFRTTLGAADRTKFDEMRERMVGGLEKLHAYEAFTAHSFLSWSQVESDAFHYTPRFVAGGGVPVTVEVPFSQLIFESRNAMPSSEAGYALVTIPTPPIGSGHIETLWNRLVDDATTNLMPTLRLSKYVDMIDLNVDADGITLDFSRLDAALAAVKQSDVHEGAALLLDMQRTYGSKLDEMGWSGAEQVRTLMQQAVTNPNVQSAFTETGMRLFAASATSGTAENDAFAGDDGANSFSGGAGDDILDGRAGNDSLTGGGGNDQIFGGDGNDSLNGNDGNDVLNGEEGNDQLYGEVGDDTLDGGTGNDYLSGGAGNDIYLFGKGDGQDTIASDYDTSVDKFNVLQFKAGVAPSDIVVKRSGDSLVLAIAYTNDKIELSSFFSGDDPANAYNPVQQVRFADGTSWDVDTVKTKLFAGTELGSTITGTTGADVIAGGSGNDALYGRDGNDTLSGGEGNDQLYGEAGDDTLDGGTGNDYLSGGTGNDTYLFGKGDGQDTITYDYDTSTSKLNVLQFKAGVAPSEVMTSRSGSDLVLSIVGSNDKVTINYFFNSDDPTNPYNPLQQVKFADGTSWGINALKTKLFAGTALGDAITGTTEADVITGGDGADVLYGRGGNDTLSGGEGNDQLYGEEGNDTLDGGTGNDYLSGGAGNDTYLFGKGDGQDTITYDYDTSAGKLNVLQFKEGVAPNEVMTSRSGSDLVLSIVGSDDKITLSYFFNGDDPANPYNPVQQVKFADGTSWNFATIQSQLSTRSSGSNYIAGTVGADVLNGGDGDDTLSGRAGNDVLNGNDGNDTLYGDAGDDILDGGAGSDYLSGGLGADTYKFGKGSGQDTIYNYDGDAVGTNADTILLGAGITATGVKLTRSSDDLVISLVGSEDTLRVQSYFDTDGASPYVVEKIKFADGTSWDTAAVKAKVLVSTAGNDTLYGYATNDVINGGDGNDDINGFGGDDTLDGGTGNDTVRGGDGNDNLKGGTGADYLYGGNGNDVLDGGADNDYLNGDAGDDILDGGAGSDYLSGGLGADTYKFGKGSGQDTIYNYDGDAVGTNADTILLGAGITATGVKLTRSSDDLVISLVGSEDTLRVQSYFDTDGASPYVVEKIKFADGTSWDTAAVKAKVLVSTAGNDTLYGYATNDVINGGDGNDDINGFGGDDTLDGGTGNDTVRGGDGNDNLKGGTGADYLYGGNGNDVLDGGADNDYLNGDAGDDILDGGAGSDYLSGGLGADTYKFGKGSGQDTIYNYDGDAVGTNADTILLGAGITATGVKLTRSSDDLVISLVGSEDTLRVQSYFDTDGASPYVVEKIKFADGTSWDTAAVKAKVLVSTAGNDTLYGYATNDVINGGDGNDDINGFGGDDTLDGGTGNDTVRGGDGNDNLKGGTGADYLYGGNGNDVLDGGADNDYLNGDAGDDILDGGAGSDYLSGGLGADTYKFGKGSGQDTIYNYDGDAVGTNADTILLGAGITATGVKLTRSSDDLVISLVGSEDTLRVQSYFDTDGASPYVVEKIKFADGTSWNYSTVKANISTDVPPAGTTLSGTAGDDTLTGGAGNDTIYGNAGNDILDGGAGDDTLDGDTGNDTYLFGKGSGRDTITSYDSTAGKLDVIQLGAGVTTSGVTLKRDGDALVLSINGSSDSLRVNYYFNTDATGGYQVEQIKFADGTIWDVNAVKAKVTVGTSDNDVLYGYATADTLSGSTGDDTLYGRAGNDTLDGGAGQDVLYGEDGDDILKGGTQNDRLYGGSGNDNLQGQDGDDTLDGGAGNDILDGGAGDDTLDGDTGNDTYLFGKGSGRDTITSYDSTAGKLDVIQLGAGVTTSGVTLKRDGDALVLSINGSSDSLRVNYYFNTDATGGYQVEQIKFADGTIWDVNAVKAKVTVGTSDNDVLYGYATADTLSGSTGDDTLYGRAGNDTLDGGAGQDVLYGEDGDDILKGGTQNDRLYGGSGNDNLQGQDGDDTLDGGAGNDILDGGAGDDTLDGDTGNDTYLFGKGSGRDTITSYDSTAGKLDVIQLGAGVTTSGVTLKRDGDALVLSINGSSDSLRVNYYFNTDATGGYQVEQIKFADGTIWDVNAVKAKVTVGTSDNDVLYGYATADTLSGSTGDDTLYGRAGNDTLDGGAGQDVLYGEDGDDILKGGTQNDRLYGGSGNDNLQGQDGDDTLDGGAGNDILDGGAGDDTLDGDTGNDTYLFGKGSGRDTITSYDSTAGKLDVIQLGAGVTTSGVTLKRDGDALVLSINGSSDSLRVNYYFNTDATGGYQVEQIKFADGTIWDVNAVKAIVLAGTAGADTITGTSGADTITGQAGADVLYGRGGNDVLSGGAGDDRLYGEEGNDTLDGGAGSDTLDGGAGNDTYLFGKGDGQDTIGYDYDTSAGKLNVLQFKAGVLASEVVASRSGSDLVLSIAGSNDKVTVGYFFDSDNPANPYNPVQQVKFADGTTWNTATILGKVFAGTAGADTITGTSGADTITGQAGADVLYGRGGNDVLSGGAGDDRLYGEEGNDTLDGGAGSDTLDGGAGNDTYLFGKGDGQDTIGYDYDTSAGKLNVLQFKAGVLASEVVASRSGSDLVLSIAGSNDKVTVGYFFDSDNPANPYNPVQQVKFADGTTWNTATILGKVFAGTAGADTITGTSGADTITGQAGADVLYGRGGNDVLSGGAGDDRLYGEEGNDTLDGGAGSDTLDGGAGNDTYLFGKGDGQDTIGYDYDTSAGKLNVLQFKAGVLASEVVASRSGSDLVLSIAGSNDKVTVGYFFDSDNPANPYNPVQQVKFADGTTWNTATILGKVFAGTAGADTITGTSGADTITGQAGADVLYGRGGNDVLSGGAGDDRLYGEEGNDTLDGGAGSDTLDGGAGNDTYLFGRGSGADVISDYDSTAGNQDLLSFGSGIAANQLWFRQAGSDLEVSIIGTTDKVNVSNWYAGSAYHVEQFKTSDGKTLVDSQVQSLVDAMATFAPPAAGQTTLPANYASSLNPAIAANWQ